MEVNKKRNWLHAQVASARSSFKQLPRWLQKASYFVGCDDRKYVAVRETIGEGEQNAKG